MVTVITERMPEPRPGEVLPDMVNVPVKEPLPPGIVPGSSIVYVGPIEPFESEAASKTLRPAKAGQGRNDSYAPNDGGLLHPSLRQGSAEGMRGLHSVSTEGQHGDS